MKNHWNLLDKIARVSIILMIWYIGGFVLGSSVVYFVHWLGLI